MQKAEDDKREFNEWTEKTRTAEAEATQKVNSKFPKPRINYFLESWKTQEEKTCKTASAWGRKEKREKSGKAASKENEEAASEESEGEETGEPASKSAKPSVEIDAAPVKFVPKPLETPDTAQ